MECYQYKFLIFVAVAATCTLASVQGRKRKPPNIVFVLADDYGYNDIGYHRSQIKTPNLDSLASLGVKLENYYVQPMCTPTRSQLMSGRYQIHTGLQNDVIRAKQPNALPDDSPTLADKMKESGYATHMVGKWHLGFYKHKYLPWNRGFDSFYGYLTGAENYFHHHKAGYLDLRSNNKPDFNQTGRYSTHLFTDKAVDVVRSHTGEKPLFLYLAYQSVHSPLQVPKPYRLKYPDIKNKSRKFYAGMVSAMDEGIGNLTQALKHSGLWANTLFVFSTDNGGQVLYGGNNFPLRGWKGSLWEGGIHGIGFVSGGHLKLKQRGVINQELIHVSDWFPTLVGLTGGSLNGTKPLDGYDQWDTISSKGKSPRKILLHNINPLYETKGKRLYEDTFDTRIRAAIRVGDMKLITGDPGIDLWVPPPDGSLIVTDEKEDPNKNVWLFNITADPNEHHDLSSNMPSMVRSLLETLAFFNSTAVTPRCPPFDPRSNPSKHGGFWGPWE